MDLKKNTGTFVVDGDNTTVNFAFTATTTKIQDTITAAAHKLWDEGYGDHGTEEDPNSFDDLTNQGKLDIVDEFVKKAILNYAKGYYVKDAVATGETTAKTEADAKYNLG